MSGSNKVCQGTLSHAHNRLFGAVSCNVILCNCKKNYNFVLHLQKIILYHLSCLLSLHKPHCMQLLFIHLVMPHSYASGCFQLHCHLFIIKQFQFVQHLLHKSHTCIRSRSMFEAFCSFMPDWSTSRFVPAVIATLFSLSVWYDVCTTMQIWFQSIFPLIFTPTILVGGFIKQ